MLERSTESADWSRDPARAANRRRLEDEAAIAAERRRAEAAAGRARRAARRAAADLRRDRVDDARDASPAGRDRRRRGAAGPGEGRRREAQAVRLWVVSFSIRVQTRKMVFDFG